MAGNLRVKGQETQIIVTVDGEPDLLINNISDAEFGFDLERLQESYLGQGFDQFDEVFNGVPIKLTGHLQTAEAIRLADRIVQRAQRRAGGSIRIDVLSTLVFPEGDFLAINNRDVKFGAIPVNVGGRKEYVSLALDGMASCYDLIQ